MDEQRKYAQDGVNVKEGDGFSAFAGAQCRETYGNSPFVEVKDFSQGHFRGPRGFKLKGLPEDCYLEAAPDGDGTKVVLVDAAHDYLNAAYGWVAMTCGDITRWGGIPLILVNNLDTATLGKDGTPTNMAFRLMMTGLRRIADEHQLVLFKGETAELPGCVTSPNPKATANYLWSGVAIGAYNPRTVITGDKLVPGLAVMALKERGFRNNGISSARKALAIRYGDFYCTNPEAQEDVQEAAAPAILYDRLLAAANGWFRPDLEPEIPVYLIAHLTGGGVRSKFADDILFPRGLSAKLTDLWCPPDIMKKCSQWRGMSDEECYETWNGGQGALVVIESNDVEPFVAMAERFNIEAKQAGRIIKQSQPSVIIESKFSGNTVIFEPK